MARPHEPARATTVEHLEHRLASWPALAVYFGVFPVGFGPAPCSRRITLSWRAPFAALCGPARPGKRLVALGVAPLEPHLGHGPMTAAPETIKRRWRRLRLVAVCLH